MLLAADVSFKAIGWTMWEKENPIACGVIENSTVMDSKSVTDDYFTRCAHLITHLQRIKDEYDPEGIVAELSSAGGKSARALAQMAMSIAVMSSFVTILKLPIESCTPTANKKTMAGKRNATKDDMITAAINIYKDIKVVSKPSQYTISKGKRAGAVVKKQNRSYQWLGGTFKNEFEHIADSIGVYHTMINSNLVKMFG